MTQPSDPAARAATMIRLLTETLAPFVERTLKQAGAGWWTNYVLPFVSPITRQQLPPTPPKGPGALARLDLADLLSLITRNWDTVFRSRMPAAARSYAEELRQFRNDFAHMQAKGLSEAAVRRAIDTAALLLESIDRSAAAAVRALNEEPAPTPPPPPPPVPDPEPPSGGKTEPPPAPPPAGPPAAFADPGLRPWRELVVPREDVRAGRLTQGQFAADLHEVYRNNPEAGKEYTDPREFFDRTYVTAGLRDFLRTALRRLTGQGGDPVIQLKTGFGGGKTHTMLALYHMAKSGAEIVSDVPVLKELSQELGVKIPKANVAVLVGTKISATAPFDDDPELKSLGISLKTLWGHMAWQLGGWNAYKLVQTADETGVAPADEIRKVLEMTAPCIVLIDELVAYGRNLPTGAGKRVPGGTLESLLSFIHSLTEIAKATPNVIIAASIPESDMEIGGVQGQQVLQRIQQTFGRIETAWQPVQPMESFEVVRRRLFERVDPDGRDLVVAAFTKYYREHPADFPRETQEREYEQRMRAAYPFHPELFDRLYQDWNGAIPHFQSTRGVLRLLAGAVQAMWRDNDPSALIMPATLRLDLPVVREELMRYLPPAFQSVIDADIEGPSSEAMQIDVSNPRFGKILAARATARTILLGSVPGKAAPGLEDVRIRLGAARPGEPVATYNDVLGRLSERLQFLHTSGSRYWFEVRPNLNKAVADRLSRISDDDAHALLEARLREDADRAGFAAKHVAPASSGDVPDEAEVRLVVIAPRLPHRAGESDSPAMTWARELLQSRGSQPRLARNMVVFAALDAETHAPLVEAAKSFIAWKSIYDERKQLNLDDTQVQQAADGRDRAAAAIAALLESGYRWVIVPHSQAVQRDGTWTVEPEQMRAIDTAGKLGGTGSLAKKVMAALQADELLLESWSPVFLTQELERWFWPQGMQHIGIKQLWEENLARYTYFPRLLNRQVLQRTVQAGAAAKDYFGYADGFADGKYLGLAFGSRPAAVNIDASAVIVRKEVAAKHQEAKAKPGDPGPHGPGNGPGGGPGDPGGPGGGGPARQEMRRFHGQVKLNPLRVAGSAAQVADEIIRHLADVPDAEVEVILLVQAESKEGFSPEVRRVVSENAAALKFQSWAFEEE
jgi:predicted AAA+ superfamily ATPase